jgi:hypothetical protein
MSRSIGGSVDVRKYLFGPAALRFSSLSVRGKVFASIAVLVVVGALTALMAGGLFWAQWSVYADHELISYRIGSKPLSLWSLPDVLLATEAGYPGQLSRYRPVTYLFFGLESLFFGTNPGHLNGARVVAMGLFFVSMAFVLFRFFSIAVALSVTALCMTFGFWKHVWIGFGVNEQYIALLAIPFLSSFFSILVSPMERTAREAWLWAICCISGVLLVGIKENMAIVGPAIVVLFAISYRRRPAIDFRLGFVLSSLTLMSMIVAAILVGVIRQGKDFYGTSISVSERALHVWSALWHYPFPLLALLLLLSAGLLAWGMRSGSKQVSIYRNVLIFQVLLTFLAVTHVYFYDGWPANSRYEFPGQLFVFAAVLGFFVSLCHLAAEFRLPVGAIEIAMVLLCLAGILFVGYRDFRAATDVYVERSREFTAALDAIVASARANLSQPIVVESGSPYDIEPVFTLNRFLLFNKVTNPIYLRTHDLERAEYPRTPFFDGLKDTLLAISRTGQVDVSKGTGLLPGYFLARFEPIGRFSSQPCLAVRLAKSADGDCKLVAIVRY